VGIARNRAAALALSGSAVRIRIFAIARRAPAWVQTAYREYARRLPPELAPVLEEIAPDRGAQRTVTQRLAAEGGRIRRALPRDAWVVALDERGESWSTKTLARQLQGWCRRGIDVALLIGGADGLASELVAGAAQRWSLSALTLPHALVRVIVIEQLYRAWSFTVNHPYHRE
jgi:23S rRNA (pseudouridine1915-N3)-methyltransferase